MGYLTEWTIEYQLGRRSAISDYWKFRKFKTVSDTILPEFAKGYNEMKFELQNSKDEDNEPQRDKTNV